MRAKWSPFLSSFFSPPLVPLNTSNVMLKRFLVTFYDTADAVVDVFTVDAIDFGCALDLICDIQTLNTDVFKAVVVNDEGFKNRVIFR